MQKIKNNILLLTIIAIFCFAFVGMRGAVANHPSFVTGQDTITAKGTPEQLTSVSIPKDQKLIIKAKTANTGIVYVGNSSANALNSGSSHFKLYPGESVELNITNLNLIWYDAETGEGIEYIVESN